MHLAEERHAPSATGSSVKALAQLTRNCGLFALNEVLHFSDRHMEAQTNLVVERVLLHRSFGVGGGRRGEDFAHGAFCPSGGIAFGHNL